MCFLFKFRGVCVGEKMSDMFLMESDILFM